MKNQPLAPLLTQPHAYVHQVYHFFGKAFGLKSIPELRPSERSSQNQSRIVGPVGCKLPNLDHFHQLPCPVAQVGLLDDLHHEILEPTVVTFGATLSVLEHLGLGGDEWYTEAVASVKWKKTRVHKRIGEKFGACFIFLQFGSIWISDPLSSTSLRLFWLTMRFVIAIEMVSWFHVDKP